MDPILRSQLRRHWQVVSALGVFVLFTVVHLVVFQPAANRLQSSLRRAEELGFALNPEHSQPRMVPPRVLALLADNSLPARTAQERGNSGALTAALLEEINRLATQHGMEVLGAEPGATAQQPQAVQVKAHFRMQCSYAEFVAFLDALSRDGLLIAVDRFTLTNVAPGRHTLDIWVTRYILKLDGGDS